MENASKALIIAGAILLAILIISLGIMIFNQASGVVNNNSMDEVEIAAFNQKFLQYENTNVKGANVNSLISTVISNNVTNQEDTSKQVKLYINSSNWQGTNGCTATAGTVALTTSTTGKAQTGKTYKVTTTPDSKTGLITLITIEDAS